MRQCADRFDPVGDWGIFPAARPLVVAGPCSVESRDMLLSVAAALKEQGVQVLRAGLWKPRTHPGCFEGLGADALEYLTEVRSRFGLKVCTEVAGPSHVAACLEAGVDMLWIGARTTVNPFQVQEIADALEGTDVPVLVKNPVSQDPGLWAGAVERLSRSGVRKIGLVHRGFASIDETRYRNAPIWQSAIEMRMRFPRLPMLCDPSHMAGKAEYVRELSQKALDLGFDGLMVEVHPDPARALSDAAQQIDPEGFACLLKGLSVRRPDAEEGDYRSSIAGLRSRIDDVDGGILKLLGDRMELSRRIGVTKRSHGVSILQASRWDEVLSRCSRMAEEYGLDEDMVRRIFGIIHEASVREQDKVMSAEL